MTSTEAPPIADSSDAATYRYPTGKGDSACVSAQTRGAALACAAPCDRAHAGLPCQAPPHRALGLSQTSYIVTSGILFLLFVLVANAIYSTRQ